MKAVMRTFLLLLSLYRLYVIAFKPLPLKTAIPKHKSYSKISLWSSSKNGASNSYYTDTVRGRIIVSGLGQEEEDEFLLSLLNSQHSNSVMDSTWDKLTLATTELASTKKTFLSRSARYSGLLNILDVVESDVTQEDQLNTLLAGANAWLAIDVPRVNITSFAEIALKNNVKRVIFTTTLADEEAKTMTELPEYLEVIDMFEGKGNDFMFTGVRHGAIIPGNENKPYEIVNGTTPLQYFTVEKGILARVTTELLHLSRAANIQCGVSSSGTFAESYLQALRGVGLTRQDEVHKLLIGGMQKTFQQVNTSRIDREREQQLAIEEQKKKDAAALQQGKQLIVDSNIDEKIAHLLPIQPIQKKKLRNFYVNDNNDDRMVIPAVIEEDEGKKNKNNKKDNEEAIYQAELELKKKYDKTKTLKDIYDSPIPLWEREDITDRTKIKLRAKQIMKDEYNYLNDRMLVQSTSFDSFCDLNIFKAEKLAMKEYDEIKDRLLSQELKAKAASLASDKKIFTQLHQYRRLLLLEEKELIQEKLQSITYMQYIFILISSLNDYCQVNDILLYNLDTFQQTILLRKISNKLRQTVDIPSSDIIFDEIYMEDIVRSYIDLLLNIDEDAWNLLHHPELLAMALLQYEELINKIPALNSAKHIIKKARDTLHRELPTTPEDIEEAIKHQTKIIREKERMNAIQARNGEEIAE